MRAVPHADPGDRRAVAVIAGVSVFVFASAASPAYACTHDRHAA